MTIRLIRPKCATKQFFGVEVLTDNKYECIQCGFTTTVKDAPKMWKEAE